MLGVCRRQFDDGGETVRQRLRFAGKLHAELHQLHAGERVGEFAGRGLHRERGRQSAAGHPDERAAAGDVISEGLLDLGIGAARSHEHRIMWLLQGGKDRVAADRHPFQILAEVAIHVGHVVARVVRHGHRVEPQIREAFEHEAVGGLRAAVAVRLADQEHVEPLGAGKPLRRLQRAQGEAENRQASVQRVDHGA